MNDYGFLRDEVSRYEQRFENRHPVDIDTSIRNQMKPFSKSGEIVVLTGATLFLAGGFAFMPQQSKDSIDFIVASYTHQNFVGSNTMYYSCLIGVAYQGLRNILKR